jgi:dihydrofolate reductase/thymidylate synthase
MKSFNVIVAMDDAGGIAKDGHIPWHSPEDLKFFRKKTLNNIVIMGKNTHVSIGKLLSNRENLIISKTMQHIDGAIVFNNLDDALKYSSNTDKKIWVIGGNILYEHACRHPLCEKIYITHIKGNYKCDLFFNRKLLQSFIPRSCLKFLDPLASVEIYDYYNKYEHKYLKIAKSLTLLPMHRNRTDMPTRSNSGKHLKFYLSNYSGDIILPLLTTKFVGFKTVLGELLFFIKGQTHVKYLHDQNIHIWDLNTTRSQLDKLNLHYDEGTLGPAYGFQWRHWGSTYNGPFADYTNKGIDQLNNVINNIKNDPFSRRHIVSAWNVADIDKMCLPPCHCFFQFIVTSDVSGAPAYLTIMLHQRSGDMFLGVPFNIASYSLLCIMVASMCNLIPLKLIINLGDCHLYDDHVQPLLIQCSRIPRKFPNLIIQNPPTNIDNWSYDNFKLVGYYPYPKISANMTV